MDATEMAMADCAPSGDSGGIAPANSQPNAAAITQACVAATEVAMTRMHHAMQAAGHTPTGLGG
jgi:hypothetical protein